MMARPKSDPQLIDNLPCFRNRLFVWCLSILVPLAIPGAFDLNSNLARSANSETNVREAQAQESELLDQAKFREMLSAGALDELSKLMDTALGRKPADKALIGMNTTLAISLIQTQPEAARARFENQLQTLLAMGTLDATCLNSLSTAANYVVQLSKEMSAEQKLAIFDQVLAKIASQTDANSSNAVIRLVMSKCELLASEDRHEEAKAALDDVLVSFRQNNAGIRAFVAIATTYSSLLGGKYPQASEKVMMETEELVNRTVESDSATASDFSTLYSLKSMQVVILSETDPEEAGAVLNSLAEKLAGLKARSDEGEQKLLSSYETAIGALRSRLEAALKRQRLVGSKAPEIDAEAFIGMKPTTMEDLRGKVVLVDFWAVWCGPCIATFPHLAKLHERYAGQGLVILGATSFYNYQWDDERGRAVIADEEVDSETELAMLMKFHDSYAMRHGFFVFGEDSDYSDKFEVASIPQAVLIDKEGTVQMIRVGAGDANAIALEEKIKELLAK